MYLSCMQNNLKNKQMMKIGTTVSGPMYGPNVIEKNIKLLKYIRKNLILQLVLELLQY